MLDRHGGRAALVAVAAGLALTVAAPAVAQDAEPEGTAASDPVDLGAYGQPIRFEAGPDTTFTLGDGTRYAEVLETRLSPVGTVTVINDVSMTTYVQGLGEVPFSWPMEALKAQAVAARTYAWYSIELGTFEERGFGYDICDTTACQVYRGRDFVLGPQGDRWAAAVEATEGEVLTYEGEPILARYFSTSGGRTRDNEEVFPNEGPRPYLKGVEDPDDAVSALHTWQVRFPRDQFDEILSRGEQLGAAVPMADIRHVDPDSGADQVVVTSESGREVTVSASAFRGFVSSVAPDLFPDDYPARWPDRDRRYPATLMSSRLSFTVTEDEVVVDGLGWGHGVGMGQFGAKGKADRGLGYEEILSAYYTGIPGTSTPADLPERVRVGIDDRSEPLTFRADGPFRVVVGGEVVTERGLGEWSVRLRGDRTLGLVAPTGYGAPLVVDPTTVDEASPTEVELVQLETVVNKPSELRLEVTAPDGEQVLLRELGIVDPGRHAVTWDLDGQDGSQLPSGRYQARLVAVDEDAVVAGDAVDVEVRPLVLGTDQASLLAARDAPAPPPVRVEPWWVLLAALGGLAVGAIAALTPRRRGADA
jgi:SpoIID/LytB domain protein